MSESRYTEIAEQQRESLTGAQKIIDNDHAYIHQGKYFTTAMVFDITTGATNKFTLQTGATKVIHYRPANIISSVDKLTMNIYEGSTVVSGGTAITPVNRNRLSALTSETILKSGVTVGTNGPKITTAYIPGATGVGGVRTGAQLSANNEWVLKADTLYTIEVINGSSGTNTVFAEFQWYEE